MMSFDWNHFLDVAKTLAKAPDEASQRSAISRAYYAAFNTAKRYLAHARSDLRIPRHGDAHELVWATLREGSRQEMSAGAHGFRLKKQRKIADYDSDSRPLALPAGAQRAIEIAEVVICSLRQLASKRS
jgi:uncharacterized protein (UPF0332 family)